MQDGVIWDGRRPPIVNSIEAAEPQAKPVAAYSSPIADAIAGRDTARIPAWFLQVVIIVLVVVVIMLWLSIRDVQSRLWLQETYNQNTREQLIKNGWNPPPDAVRK